MLRGIYLCALSSVQAIISFSMSQIHFTLIASNEVDLLTASFPLFFFLKMVAMVEWDIINGEQ